MRIGRRNLEHRGWRMMWMGRKNQEQWLETDVYGTEKPGTMVGE